MLSSATSRLATLSLAAASLTFAGCGGSSHPPNPAKPQSTQAFQHAPTAPASTTAGSSSDPRSVPGQCVASSLNNPANFTVCLAKHGVQLPTGGGKVAACMQSASSTGRARSLPGRVRAMRVGAVARVPMNRQDDTDERAS